ncbi:DUF2283 domain-containing protein [Polaromonas sp. YR568]|uniref:DUF2283 domain-containing protein n=1 Tax=Polaromonas sp. YR568 TaxID=1855301 RepID=UPI00398C0B79
MPNKNITLDVSSDDEDVAYLSLPNHPGRGSAGVVAKQVRLLDLLQYVGPDIYLDLDEDGRLIGFEILA